MIQTAITVLITSIFLVIVLSYYFLLFKRRTVRRAEKFSSLSIIIPAHNEAKYIAECIVAAQKAPFPGKKQIIVVDDGSADKTGTIAKELGVTVIRTAHLGKSAAINTALKRATGELVAVIDADSVIQNDALVESLKLFSSGVGAVCATVKVKNRNSVIGFYVHVEQLYNTLIRSLVSKVNANIVTAGPLTIFRKSALIKVNGFATEGFAEDIDIAVRLIRAGYVLEFADRAVVETYMPTSPRRFLRQRTRFARGIVNALKKHLKFNRSAADMYTLPLLCFSYFQAVIMGSITLYNIATGYYTYFVAKGVYVSWLAARFFLEWFSIIGLIHWISNIIQGVAPLGIIEGIGLTAALLSYPLYFIAICKYDRLSVWHVLAIAFLTPFWLIIMFVYVLNIDAWFQTKQYNRWEKA